jgi:hypothetical protein
VPIQTLDIDFQGWGQMRIILNTVSIGSKIKLK